jgi:hypothetical protein
MDIKEKISFAAMSVIGVIALTLGFIQFKTNLGVPFIDYKPMSAEKQQQILANIEGDLENGLDAATLKNQDSDNDGISDYDETYTYHTSPYLADSDADGFSDKEEVASGNDPLCPTGKVCAKEVTPVTNINSSANENSQSNTNVNLPLGLDSLIGNSATNISPDTLRQYLKQAGATDEMLASINDDALMNLYEEALNKAAAENPSSETGDGSNPSISANTNADANQAFLDTAANMTPDQIRTYLKQAGAPAATVDSVDDATLKKMFLEAAANQIK